MEVKIGVQNTPREIAFESAQSPTEVEQTVTAALRQGEGVISLVDEKGRRIIVPTAVVAYVEIAESEVRRVGFGAN